MLNISELKLKWNKEKNSYIKQEVGSGVQKFVKDVLKSKEIFNLKEGLNSTKLENRQNEFKEEEKKKSATHADVVIYINQEIIIPLEVERFKNISAGEKQIIQYQLEWNEHSNRRYGILTDGWIWRFYNNNEYRTFILDDLLKQTEIFLEFWQEYIKPEFYYLAFFEKKGQESFFKETEILPVEKFRQIFFDDITKLIKGFKNKLGLEGYLKNTDIKNREKIAVEITYAYIIQFILYKTLVDNDFGKFKKEFNERQQSIYECLKAGRFGEILGVIDGISSQISENIYRKFSQEQEFISGKLLELIRQPKNELPDVSPWLDIFVFIKKYNFANVRNEIFGYIYENYLKELYADTKKGQYFTDPAVVNFMLDMVGYKAQEIKNSLYYDRYGERGFDNHISIIDPSCGCGTFLYSAVDRIIAGTGYESEKASRRLEHLISQSVFGLDIEEFPLYLAEMNVLMRMLPMILHKEYNNPVLEKIKVFKTNDSVAEFLDTAIKNTLNDIDVAYQKNNGQLTLFTQKLNLGYVSYVRDEGDLAEMKKSLENRHIPRRRFDFVIGNPPYVSYNECSKAELLIFKLIKQGKVKLNDIYGVNLHSIPDHRKKYSPKPNLYAFFIALGIALLKDGAKICYIVPQTLLTAGDLDVLRYHLAKFTTLEKIITFSGKMFIGRGLKQDQPVATSSLVFVASRQAPEITHEVEVINYKNPNDDIEECLTNILAYNHKKIDYRRILQNKFLQNAANWNFIKQDKKFLDFYEEYKKNTDDISIYYNHATAEYNFKSRFYFDKGIIFPRNKIVKINTIQTKDFYIFVKLTKERYLVSDNSFVVDKKDISLSQGSQGFLVFEKKYKIVWSYMNPNHFYFTDKRIILNFNYILISSDNKKEILYLFSLLNSISTNILFYKMLTAENEKDILIGITAIKNFVRIPKITEANQFIKDEIIEQTGEIFNIENIKLSDLVDFNFGGVLNQKIDQLKIMGNNLLLINNQEEMKLPFFSFSKIKTKYFTGKDTKMDSANLIKKAIFEFMSGDKLRLEKKKVELSELKELPIIDFKSRDKIKDYIDDLVFALYFNVLIRKVGVSLADEIKKKCEENKFYKILNKYGDNKNF